MQLIQHTLSNTHTHTHVTKHKYSLRLLVEKEGMGMLGGVDSSSVV